MKSPLPAVLGPAPPLCGTMGTALRGPYSFRLREKNRGRKAHLGGDTLLCPLLRTSPVPAWSSLRRPKDSFPFWHAAPSGPSAAATVWAALSFPAHGRIPDSYFLAKTFSMPAITPSASRPYLCSRSPYLPDSVKVSWMPTNSVGAPAPQRASTSATAPPRPP